MLLAVSNTFKKRFARAPEAIHDQLDHALQQTNASTPLGLVVRDNRVTPSQWHRDTLAASGMLFDALDRLCVAEGPISSR